MITKHVQYNPAPTCTYKETAPKKKPYMKKNNPTDRARFLPNQHNQTSLGGKKAYLLII